MSLISKKPPLATPYKVRCHHCYRPVTDDCVSIDRLKRRDNFWARDSDPYRFHLECFLEIAGERYVPKGYQEPGYDEIMYVAETGRCYKCETELVLDPNAYVRTCNNCGWMVTEDVIRHLTMKKRR
jgi:hypothetical protein